MTTGNALKNMNNLKKLHNEISKARHPPVKDIKRKLSADKKLHFIKDHLTVIRTTLDRFVDRAAELELCCKMFSTFEEASNQDDILTQFDSKIKKGKSFIKITGSSPVESGCCFGRRILTNILSVCEDGRISGYRYASGLTDNVNIN